MGIGVKNQISLEKADTSIPVNSSWWLGLLVLLALIALPTGYDALFLPWFCVEFAGTGLLLWCGGRGKRPRPSARGA